MIRLLIRKTLRDLRAAAAQTAALVVIVALGVASLVALISAYRDLGTSYDRTYERLHFADATLAVQAAPASIVSEIARVDGVRAVTGRLVVDTGIAVPEQGVGTTQVRARLIGIPAGSRPAVDDVLVTAGGYFPSEGAGSASPEVLVESHFAKVYHYRPGSTVHPIIGGKQLDLRVAGIAATPEYLIVSASRQEIIPSARTFGVLFVPLGALQRLTGSGDSVNNIAVLLDSGTRGTAALSALRSLLAPYGLSTVTLQKDQPSAAALRLDLEGYREIGYLMPLLILLASAASLFVMQGRQVRAQQTQIGLMKALGYSRRAIIFHFLGASLLVGLLGAAVGIAAGFPLGHEITSAYAAELGIPLVQSRFYADLTVIGFVVPIVVALLSGLAPALRASKLHAATAMRPDPAHAIARGRRSFVERLLPPTIWARLPARNVFRVWSRSFSTSVGIVFAFILVLSSWALIESLTVITYRNFHQIERWDLYVLFDEPEPSASFARIRSLPGVREAEPLVQMPVTLSARAGGEGAGSGSAGRSEQLFLTAIKPATIMHSFELAGGVQPAAALEEQRIIISKEVAKKLGLSVGDTASLATLLGPRTVAIGALTNELAAGTAYAALATVEGWIPFHASVYNAAYLKADPSAVSRIKEALYHLPGAASVQVKSAVEQDWQSLMGLYYAFMGVILVFSLAMAFSLLFNAMTVNVLEQQREFATMRAIGTPGMRIALLMTTESAILWLITLVPGLVLGTLAARGMGSAFSSDLFSFQITISPASYLLASLGILATMILSALPAIRRVNRLDLAQATKVLT